MITKDEFTSALTNPDYFSKGLVYTIIEGKDTCTQETYKSYVEFISALPELVESKTSFKIQGFETFNKEIYNKCHSLSGLWNKPVDCHAYWSYQNKDSFKLHMDPCEVAIFVCSGTKIVTVDKNDVTLKENDHVFIKSNTMHKAFHETDVLSLSFGTFDYDANIITDTGLKI